MKSILLLLVMVATASAQTQTQWIPIPLESETKGGADPEGPSNIQQALLRTKFSNCSIGYYDLHKGDEFLKAVTLTPLGKASDIIFLQKTDENIEVNLSHAVVNGVSTIRVRSYSYYDHMTESFISLDPTEQHITKVEVHHQIPVLGSGGQTLFESAPIYAAKSVRLFGDDPKSRTNTCSL